MAEPPPPRESARSQHYLRRPLQRVALVLLVLLLAVAGGTTGARNRTRDLLYQLQHLRRDWAARHPAAEGVIYVERPSGPLRLDVYRPLLGRPTAIYFHGGGWTYGSKENARARLWPYLSRGWGVVNANYRLTSVASAPAAIEDARAVLAWTRQHGSAYGIDSGQLVLVGESAGGELALVVAADSQSSGPVLAVVSWFGVADVSSLVRGPYQRGFAAAWVRDHDPAPLSPVHVARAGMPPVLTIHGDADRIVPYQDAVRLRDRLGALGVPNVLVRVPGGAHPLSDDDAHAAWNVASAMLCHLASRLCPE